jgi:two-component system sensor histidine kinase YesM
VNWLRFSDVGIRKKLFALLLVLLVVPFLIYTTIIVSQVSGQMETLGFHTADLVLGQTANFVESRVDLVKRALDLITLNPVVRELSAADPAPYDADPGLWIRDATALKAVEDTVGQNNPDIRAFVLSMAAGLGASSSRYESPQFLALADQKGERWLTSMDPGENAPRWFSPSVDFVHAVPGDLHVVRRIPDDLDLSATVGYVRADVKVRGIEEILDKAEFSAGTATFLVDREGALVARSRQARRLGNEELTKLASVSGAPWASVAVGGTDYRIGRAPIGTPGWTLITAIPNRDIGAFGDQVRNLLLVVLACMLPLMIPLSLWAAASSTRRLNSLLAGVRHLGEGGLDIELPVDSRDEIGELTRNFNRMVGRIRALADERYRLGLEVKDRELQALQAQINPHFLYNTLDLINGLALIAGEPKIVETVSALSRFYRLTLAGGADTVPLQTEFDHAAAYVRIQNLRFDNTIELRLDLDPAVAGAPVLKTLLQPLVENAILHGIREKPSERGWITITARPTPGQSTLVVVVEDDGVGMDATALQDLLTRERFAGGDGHGFGVFNIDRRLRLRYGDAAGLRYDSVPGRGTRVSITLPF